MGWCQAVAFDELDAQQEAETAHVGNTGQVTHTVSQSIQKGRAQTPCLSWNVRRLDHVEHGGCGRAREGVSEEGTGVNCSLRRWLATRS